MINPNKYLLTVTCLLLFFFSCQGQIRFESEQGSFLVSFKANTKGSASVAGTDFTKKQLAVLEFFDVEDPLITVSVSNLKWAPGFENYTLVIKNNWVVHSSGINKLEDYDRQIQTDKEMAQFRFQPLGDGKEEITLKFGIKSPKQNLKKVKPKNQLVLQKKFSTLGVNKSSNSNPVSEEIKETKLPVENTIKETKLPEEPIANNNSQSDDIVWRSALVSNSRSAMENYLQQFPQGKHAYKAKRYIADYSNPESATISPISLNSGESSTSTSEMMQDSVLLLSNKNWARIIFANTFSEYYNYLKANPAGRFAQVAKDSISNKPILWEKISQEEKTNGNYIFNLQFSEMGAMDLASLKESAALEIKLLDSASHKVQVTIKDSKSHECLFKDEFGRSAIVQLNPQYKMLNAILEDKGEMISYKIVGGLPPYYINFIAKGSDFKQCMQRLKKNGEILKSEWADNCDLNGIYRIEISDATKNEIKRFPEIKFVDNSFNVLKYMWIVFLPILFVLMWFVKKRI